MPRTPGHLVDCHRIRHERARRGMKPWAHTIRLGYIFHNDSMTFIQRRDAIVSIIKKSEWVNGNDELADCMDRLEQSQDEEEFDQYWDELYDYADLDSVWIDTFNGEKGE